MSEHLSARRAGGGEASRGLRLAALIAVIVGVLVLAAAAFVLSYPGIHAIALQTGVSPSLARVYPLIIDAMLVVACAAVLSSRGAGLISRLFAWLSLLALLAVAATADALHATAVHLPARPAAAAVAILPWALVLIGFGLLITMLRHARLRRQAAAASQQDPARNEAGGRRAVAAPGESPAHWPAAPGWQPSAQAAIPALPAALPAAEPDGAPEPDGLGAADELDGPGTADEPDGRDTAGEPDGRDTADELDGPGTATGPGQQTLAGVPRQRGWEAAEAADANDADADPDADDADPDDADAAADPDEPGSYRPGSADLAVDAEPGLDDPSSDEAGTGMVSAGSWPAGEPPRHSAGYGRDDDSEPVITLSPAPVAEQDPPDPDMPVFHRVRSAPTPPEEN